MPESRLDALARRFLDRSLPRKEWTHEAHLRVGLWHLLRYPPGESLDRLRSGIREYNEAVGVGNTDTSGYSETITRFYVDLIADFVRDGNPSACDDELADRLVRELGEKKMPERQVK